MGRTRHTAWIFACIGIAGLTVGCSGILGIGDWTGLTDGGTPAANSTTGVGAGGGDASSLGDGTLAASDASAVASDGSATASDGSATAQEAGDSGVDGAGSSTCIVARTCDPTCNQLVENGVSEYIEPRPDDGSALPTQTLAELDALFANPSASGGPCIAEPPAGALFPNNWIRPRIYYQPSTGQTLFQIRIHAARQANDLVVYTESTSWEIPKDIWTALCGSTWGEDITVTVSGSSGSGTAASSATTFQIAPASAGGTILYSAAVGDENGFSWLEGFRVGDEGVSSVLTAPTGLFADAGTNVQWIWSRDLGGNLSISNETTNVPLPSEGDVQCIGCHTPAPDGNSVVFNDFYPWDGVASSVDMGSVGQPPSWLTPGGAETLSQGGLGMMTFSTSVWSAGRNLVIAGSEVPQNSTEDPWISISTDNLMSNLIWIDLSTSATPVFLNDAGTPLASAAEVPASPFYANQGTTYGYIARTGDTRSASCPSWSHDGTAIVYASNNAPMSGRLATGASDLYWISFNAQTKQSGPAQPVPGASSPTVNEYYPAFSPDNKYIAYNAAAPTDSMYYNPNAEVAVVPFNGGDGGTAVRLSANDPASCQVLVGTDSAATSPGIYNSSPQWSPANPTCAGKTYYWVVFASARLGIPFLATSNPRNFQQYGAADAGAEAISIPTSQLYLTAIVDDGSGNLQTFPATYIWNQPIVNGPYNQSNYRPQWDVVNIPPPVPAAPPPPP